MFFLTPCPLWTLCAESDLACGANGEDTDTPTHSDGEDRDEEPVAPLASTNDELGSDLEASTGKYQIRLGSQTIRSY